MKVTLAGKVISAGYGVVSNVHPNGHNGIDFAVPLNSPLYAPADGVARVVDYGEKGFGKAVFVKMNDGNEYVLGHLSELKVKTGEIVHKGDLLGLSGSTGRSTGPHVHFGIYDQHGVFFNPDSSSLLTSYKMSLFQTKGIATGVMDGSIGNGIRNFFGDTLGAWFTQKMDALLNVLNGNSTEIIVMAVIVCAFMGMLAPMFGSSSGKWFGGAFLALVVGVIWRLLI
jgi:murein DD-endopeptidase MepM/ murein hydrolase activator NlpD